MSLCCKPKCTLAATHSVVLCVPAKGFPQNFHPLKSFLSLKFCEAHAKRCEVKNILSDDLKETIKGFVRSHGKQAPDFKRAFTKAVNLDDPEYMEFEAKHAGMMQ